MSQTATPQAAPPPPPPAPAAAVAAPAPAAVAQAAPSYVDTPALLNRWQLIGMSVAIVFGLVSALVQFVGWQSDGRAADDTAQLVRIQKIQASLLNADALSTNAFLVGGLENTTQRAQYDASINEALKGIAAAAEAQPADQKLLAELNQMVNDYVASIAQARANNRQGFPVGAAYQNLASAQLRADAVPRLEALVDENNKRAEDAMGGQHPFWLLGLGILALVGQWWLNRELAQTFRRRINKGVAIAAAIVAGVSVVTIAGAWIRDSSNDSLRDGAFADAVSAATARTAANDAKANESLRLIKRGSGADNETAWAEKAQVVDKNAPDKLLGDWNTYTGRHAEIVKLDTDNNWEGAVRLATTADDKTGSTAPFEAFDKALEGAIKEDSDKAVGDLRSGRWLALVLSGLTVLLGVGAAVSVARGIGVRRREFS